MMILALRFQVSLKMRTRLSAYSRTLYFQLDLFLINQDQERLPVVIVYNLALQCSNVF